eukprot:4006007-Amphidinium_carterae.1
MACRNCTKNAPLTKLGKWKNLGTLWKQECKPKAKRQAGRAGKAPQREKGEALPAPPPGSLTKGRTKGPNKKPRLEGRPEQLAPVVLNTFQALVEQEHGANQDAFFSSSASPST